MVHWYFLALLYGIIFAFACHYIAGEKGKNQTTWAVIGFFLGLIGLLIIGFSEKEIGETRNTYSQLSGELLNEKDNRDREIDAFVIEKPVWRATYISNESREKYSWPDDGAYVGEARQLTHGEMNEGEIGTLAYERHGKGKHVYPSGAKYVGKWINDKENGKGTFYSADGAVYVGDFRNGMFHGNGIITYADGSVKSGNWERGRFMGVKRNKNLAVNSAYENKLISQKYDGEYKNGMKHGWGTYVYHSGATYVGEWENDMENGRGTFTLIDGTVYIGEFKDGKFHGNGTLSHTDGRQQSGEWKLGRYIG